jgi:hypothetical protein
MRGNHSNPSFQYVLPNASDYLKFKGLWTLSLKPINMMPEPLLTIESEKAQIDVEAEPSGVLRKIIAKEGEAFLLRIS